MRNSMVVVVLIVVLNILLAACSDNPTTRSSTPAATTRAAQTTEDADVDFSLLEDYVNAINDQFVEAALNLFNDEAVLSEIDQVFLMSNLHQNGWNHIYTGKTEIKEWLEVEIGSNPQIEPVEYRLYANYPSMYGVLYYQDQVIDLQLIEKSKNGKINFLIYNIVKKKFS
jgi:hypothetical protein